MTNVYLQLHSLRGCNVSCLHAQQIWLFFDSDLPIANLLHLRFILPSTVQRFHVTERRMHSSKCKSSQHEKEQDSRLSGRWSILVAHVTVSRDLHPPQTLSRSRPCRWPRGQRWRTPEGWPCQHCTDPPEPPRAGTCTGPVDRTAQASPLQANRAGTACKARSGNGWTVKCEEQSHSLALQRLTVIEHRTEAFMSWPPKIYQLWLTKMFQPQCIRSNIYDNPVMAYKKSFWMRQIRHYLGE